MRVGFVQTRPIFGHKKSNIECALALAEETAGDLLVFPELFSTGYFFPSKADVFKLAESVPDGPTIKTMKAFGKKKRCALVFGVAEYSSGRVYNSAVYLTSGGEIHLYRKLHLFNLERLWFSPGNLKLKVYPFYEYKIGLMICFDWIFPEVCRILALRGAQLICHPANLVLPYCQQVMRARSIENRIFTITSNRVGRDIVGAESFRFTGQSQITAPDGTVLTRAGKTEPISKCVDLDLQSAKNKQLTKYNNILTDRRAKFYGELVGKSGIAG